MKIIQFIPSLNSGGAERFVVDLSNSLATNNKVYLFTLLDINEHGFYKRDLCENVELISLNKKLGVNLLLPFKIFFKLRKIKPDIVNTHLSPIFYLFLCFFTLKKTFFFHTIHNDARKEAKTKFGYFIKLFLFKSKLVSPITISDESSRGFQSFYGLDSHQINNGRYIDLNKQYINNSLFEDFKKTPNTKILLSVGRIVQAKNQIMLANAFNILISKGYDISLLIIGNKRDKEIATKIKLINKDIYLLGQVSNPLDYIANANVFCLSSLYEGMPISLIECFGVAAIPICTPVGGIKDMIVDGKNGFLSEDISLESYVVALEKYLSLNEDGINKMKNHSKKEYQNYSMETCANKYKLVYQKKL
jgi:glycosyltransferase involved in cell wall biosynthesis